ncbi:Ail/Lom family outer membrane beta-barrel protein, partial [Escherichia coli]
MRKLYAAILSAAICLAVSGAPAWAFIFHPLF